jgi:type IV secretory pathway protease TraF
MCLSHRLTLCAAALALSVALLVGGRGEPWLIYNGSPSAPVGFYLRTGASPATNTYVTVRAAEVAPLYAALRGFDDPTDRFIKRVAAGPGDHVCAAGAEVVIEGYGAVARLERDAMGRPLPAWTGCRSLGDDEVFLIGGTTESFDSRYWGPVRRDAIDGVWRRMGEAS